MIDRNDDTDFDPRLVRALRDAAPTGFAPGFAERVGERLAQPTVLTFESALQRQFVRIVPFAAAASLLLAGWGWWGGRQASDSVIDAMLRLPQVTIASAYSSDLFTVGGQAMETP